MARFWSSATCLVLVLGANGTLWGQDTVPLARFTGLCGPIENAFGPFDFRTVERFNRQIVERAHFTLKVETLRAGERGTIGGDLDYTLRAMPNHPRALMAMVRLAEREHKPQPAGANYPVECYFERAIRFVPDDPMVRVLYGIFLAKASREEEARFQLNAAEAAGEHNSQIAYNLGLAYLELRDYGKANVYAKKAQEMGLTLDGLRKRLERVGQLRP